MTSDDAYRAGRAVPTTRGADPLAPEEERRDIWERLSQLRAEGAELRARLAAIGKEVAAAQATTSKTLKESAELLSVIRDWEQRYEAGVRRWQWRDGPG